MSHGQAPSLVIVAGSGRSGTSLASGLMHRLGLHIPQPEIAANKTNPRGFGEPEWAVEFHQRLLHSYGVRLEDGRPRAWELAARAAQRPQVRAELRAWLEQQIAQSDRVVIKDPRLTWFTDLYRAVADELSVRLTVVTMLRHPVETTKSRELAYGRSGQATSRLAAWVNVMLHVEHLTRDLPRAMVPYEDLLDDWRGALQRADVGLGLDLFNRAGERELAEAGRLVDPTLRRASGDWGDLAVPEHLQQLAEQTWQTLGRLADPDQGLDVRQDLDDLRDAYNRIHTDALAIARSSIQAARVDERRKAAAQVPTTPLAPTPVRAAAGRARKTARRAAGRAKRTVQRRLEEGRRADPSRDRVPVYLLVWSVDQAGGVARTVSTLASGLAGRHPVEIISLFRHRDRLRFELDERVRVTYLEDQRAHGPSGKPVVLRARDNPARSQEARALDSRPSNLTLKEDGTSELTDKLLHDALADLPPGILVSNRPVLHLAAAHYAPERVRRIAVEHTSFADRGRAHKEALRAHSDRLDVLVTLTDADHKSYAELFSDCANPPVTATIPNAVPPGVSAAATPERSRTIVAAGSLIPLKAYGRLIDAFAPLAVEFPEWRLHIYGRGRLRPALQEQISNLGLQGQVALKGFHADFTKVLTESAVLAVSSRHEAFPMVILEAMGTGLPVIAFDCPTGPRHMIEHERTGLLIPDGDVQAYTEGLRRLMADGDLRQSYGAQGARSVQRYSIGRVVAEWESLIDRVAQEARR